MGSEPKRDQDVWIQHECIEEWKNNMDSRSSLWLHWMQVMRQRRHLLKLMSTIHSTIKPSVFFGVAIMSLAAEVELLRQNYEQARLREILARLVLLNTFPNYHWSPDMQRKLDAAKTCAISDGIHHPMKIFSFHQTSDLLSEYAEVHPTEFDERFCLRIARRDIYTLDSENHFKCLSPMWPTHPQVILDNVEAALVDEVQVLPQAQAILDDLRARCTAPPQHLHS